MTHWHFDEGFCTKNLDGLRIPTRELTWKAWQHHNDARQATLLEECHQTRLYSKNGFSRNHGKKENHEQDVFFKLK